MCQGLFPWYLAFSCYSMGMRLVGLSLFIGWLFLWIQAPVLAANLGVHLLDPAELSLVSPYRGENEAFFVTVPYSLFDRRADIWERFFQTAEALQVTPIVRLTTEFQDGAWQVPQRVQVTAAARFLRKLPWKEPRYVVLFNEPNHAAEWGGVVNPDDYARRALFTARWFQTETLDYVVLPAGLDAAAPNGTQTMESFTFMDRVLQAEPEFLEAFDGWTSHAYPNQGFVGSAYDVGKHSIRGFEHELAYLSRHGKGDWQVYITETGWKQTKGTIPRLATYYQYAHDYVWSHPQVKAVTVFLLQGGEGPFAAFSLLYPNGSPTPQLSALQKILEITAE